MGRKYQVISGDGHLETPPDFVAFLPEKYKDRAPKLISLPDGGGDAWLMEGMPLTYASQNLRGRGKVKFAGQSYFKDDGSRTDGAGDGLQRLQEQDEDGLDAELLFVPVFASRFIEKIPDHDAYLAMVQAYNDWLASYCSIAPDRLIGNALMPVSGIDDAIAELERVDAMGFKSVQPPNSPNGGNGPKPDDDRFWEKALELEMALSPHMSFAGVMNIGGPRHDTSQWPAEAGMTQARGWRTGQHDGAAHRRPHVRALPGAEVLLRRDQRRDLPGGDLLHGPRLPRVQQLVRARAPEDAVAVHEGPRALRHGPRPLAVRIGQELPDDMPLELFWWGSDFPHSVGTFPHSRKYIEETFADLSPELRHTLLVGNGRAPPPRPRRRHHGDARGVAGQELGPKRSARTRDGSTPSPVTSSPTVSANGADPHT